MTVDILWSSPDQRARVITAGHAITRHAMNHAADQLDDESSAILGLAAHLAAADHTETGRVTELLVEIGGRCAASLARIEREAAR
jgi:hypothetical protein